MKPQAWLRLKAWIGKLKYRDSPVREGPVVSGKRILLASDDETRRESVKALLETDRHVVTVARSGKDANEILRSLGFDLVILDSALSDTAASAVLEPHRSGAAPAPVLMMSAKAGQENADTLRKRGASAVLGMPLTLAELRKGIAEVFPEQAKAHSLATAPAAGPQAGEYIDHRAIHDLKELCPYPEFLTQLLTTAITDIDMHCKKLLAILDESNLVQIHANAHALKGVSSSVGAVQLASIAAQLMDVGIDDLQLMRERWKRDIRELQELSVRGIRQILSNGPR